MIQPTFLGMLGTNEIIIILVIVLLLFGGRKIPELMRGLGKGVREFNDAKSNVKKEIDGKFLRNPWGYPVSPAQPGYREEWLRTIINETGNKFKVPNQN